MRKQRILVVDDNEEIRQFLDEAVLSPAGYTVVLRGDGQAALNAVRDTAFDLVITDHRMPLITGLELMQQLRCEQPDLPVILITGEGSEELAVEALRAGALDYLIKPFDVEQLLKAVDRAWNACEDASETGMGRRLEELEALALIGRTVTASLEVDEVLKTVVDAAVQLTNSEEGSLLLLEEDGGELYMRASKNFDDDFARTFRLKVEDSLAGHVIETGEPVLLDETTPKKIKTAYLVHSLIYVPLRVRGKTIGVLGVDNRKAGRELEKNDVTVLMAMGDYAAIAVENARLFASSEKERRTLESILTQAETGVLVLDDNHCIQLINCSAREAIGVDECVEGRSIVEIVDDPVMLSLVRDERPEVRWEEIAMNDGRVYNAVRTPIRGVGQAIVMHDITHLKELDRIKSEFVTAVSHDLRSPLTAILGYVELLERVGSLTPQQQEFIKRIKFSVEQITRLVTDLLDLGRIEAGLDNTKEKTPISVLARYSAESLRGITDTKDIHLQVEVDDDLPLVSGDPIRLRQMIGNLLENAVKYSSRGGTVHLEALSEDHQVILRVSDNGPGIPPSEQPYLFDKFFRASNVPEDVPGTGLGLSIVKSIVDNHDGRIWVDSQVGKGTTFTVVLPALI
jgi:two-component system phosphate regulon sensor histidine kinase PhoR